MSDENGGGTTAPSGRYAILVDAGYLYATVGLLVAGTAQRRALAVNSAALITALFGRAETSLGTNLLRLYWYDAARDKVPTVEQRAIAMLPNVKVRLGNLNRVGEQKGVDALVRQDLDVLARHRAVTDAVLLAGDEDMLSAVEAAQAFGVRIHVWGVEPPYGSNQAERLIWEADTVTVLDTAFWQPYVRPSAPPTLRLPDAASTEIAPAALHVEQAAPAVEPVQPTPPVPTPAELAARFPHAAIPEPRLGPSRDRLETIGVRIAERWLVTRGKDHLADLLPGPQLPSHTDKELLVEAEQHLGQSLRPFPEARRALRDGFWSRVYHEFGRDNRSVPS